MLLTFAETLFLAASSAVASRILPAILITAGLGLVAWLVRGVSPSGAIAGSFSAPLIYFGLGAGGFVTLAAVFALTWFCTQVGRRKKRLLGSAENDEGRDAGQVLANTAAAAVFAALALKVPLFAIAAIASLAEAAADTAQSEIGEISSKRAWLITNLKQVPPGTDGALSLPGTLAGIVAACIVSAVAVLLKVISPGMLWLVAYSGFLGTIIDSLLGATLEHRRQLSNNSVNLLSTVSAGLIAFVFSRIF
jgi:uncharacterized protein (TIGR00297 family)